MLINSGKRTRLVTKRPNGVAELAHADRCKSGRTTH
ncbi:hypothetical protein GZL_04098 [Streptomyces sp. 769]|nr:hypothetical protein GZL_04098 [Streptomyces sp. 769]